MKVGTNERITDPSGRGTKRKGDPPKEPMTKKMRTKGKVDKRKCKDICPNSVAAVASLNNLSSLTQGFPENFPVFGILISSKNETKWKAVSADFKLNTRKAGHI